jgi:hypothetical protein
MNSVRLRVGLQRAATGARDIFPALPAPRTCGGVARCQRVAQYPQDSTRSTSYGESNIEWDPIQSIWLTGKPPRSRSHGYRRRAPFSQPW